MSKLFLHLLNISITAGWIVLIVTALRFVLKRAPKWIRVALWGLVALRLLLPVSVQSVLSLVPSAETVSVETVTYPASAQAAAPAPAQGERIVIETGFPALNSAVNPTAEQAAKQVDTVAVLKTVAVWVWLSGAAAMLLYALISYLRLRYRVRASVRLEKGAYLCDDIKSPFILGLFLPKIYLPSGTDEATKGYVLAHERAHLRRFDHVWKPLGFLLLSVYWFNPLLWLAYILLCRDIELACDEKVVKEYDDAAKAAYSEALVKSSVSRRSIAACPLAFGETGVKSRVKSILNYKKPAFWIILVALLAGVVVGVCFLTVPRKNKSEEADAAPKSAEDMKVAYILAETGGIAYTNINANIWDGLTAFGEAHGWRQEEQYTYYRPYAWTTEAYIEYMEKAIQDGQTVLICAGENGYHALSEIADQYPDTQFLMIDYEQCEYAVNAPNVFNVTFNIHEAGYLAGYAAVAEGYRNLAYLGFEPDTQSEPFVQGVNEAAEKLGVSADVRIINDRDTVFDKDKIAELYRTGTEVIYAPFVDLFAIQAARDTGGKVITVDTVNIDYDQGTNILCCTKRYVTSAVRLALDTLWNNGGKWPQDCAGAQQVLGLNNGGVGLYTEPEFWRFENFTSDAYYELLDSLLDYDVLESYNKKVESAVVVTEWLDYYSASDQMPWDEKKRIGIDAINNVRFEWTSGSVEAIYDGATHTLFTGMPIWNVFIADITRDGKPELCATVSFGSGIVDDHIVVYDYANRQSYTLWDRGTFDYHLYTADGALYVGKTPYMGDKQVDYGTLMMHDGVLCCRWQSDSSFTSLNRELCASELYGEWLVEEETDADGNVLYTFDVASTWKEYNFREDGTVVYNETVPISSDSELAFGHPVSYPYEVHNNYVYIAGDDNSGAFRWGSYDRDTRTLTLMYGTDAGTVYAKLMRMGEDTQEEAALDEATLCTVWQLTEIEAPDGSSGDPKGILIEEFFDFRTDGTVHFIERNGENYSQATATYTLDGNAVTVNGFRLVYDPADQTLSIHDPDPDGIAVWIFARTPDAKLPVKEAALVGTWVVHSMDLDGTDVTNDKAFRKYRDMKIELYRSGKAVIYGADERWSGSGFTWIADDADKFLELAVTLRNGATGVGCSLAINGDYETNDGLLSAFGDYFFADADPDLYMLFERDELTPLPSASIAVLPEETDADSLTQEQADAFVSGLSVEFEDGSPYGCDLVVFIDGFGKCLNVGDADAWTTASLRFVSGDYEATAAIYPHIGYAKLLTVGDREYYLGSIRVLLNEGQLDCHHVWDSKYPSADASIFVPIDPSMMKRNRAVSERACVIKSFDAENRTVTVSYVSVDEPEDGYPAEILYDTVEDETFTVSVTDDTMLTLIPDYTVLVKPDRFFRYLEEYGYMYLNGVDAFGDGDDRGTGFWIGLAGNTLLYLCEVYEE